MNTKKPIVSALLLLILGTAFLSFGLYFCLKLELYRATCHIRLNRNIIPEFAQTNVDSNPHYIQTEFEVIQSEAVLDKAINTLNSNTAWTQPSGNSAKLKTSRSRMLLRNRIELRLTQNTNLIEISAYNHDKSEAPALANAVADAYRDYRQTQARERTLASIKAQEAQLDEVKDRIKKLEAALADGIQPPQPEPEPEFVSLGGPSLIAVDYEKIRTNAEAQYMREKQLLDHLNSLTPQELRTELPIVAPDSRLSQLLQAQTEAQSRVITLGQDLDETDPELQRATKALADLDRQIENRIQGLLEGMNIHVLSLKAVLDNSAAKIQEIKSDSNSIQKANAVIPTSLPAVKDKTDSRQNVRLAYQLRELQHSRDVLELHLSKLPVAKNAPVEIIDRAQLPSHPIFPNRAFGIILLVAAFAADGAGLRLLRSASQRKIQPQT